MRSPDRLLITFGLLLLTLLAVGLRELFQLREETGDIYAPYSTLRSDPLGAKALFTALTETPALTVERHFRPVAQLQPRQATVFFLGTGAAGFVVQNQQELQQYARIAAAGNRVVITFRPVTEPPRKPRPTPTASSGETAPMLQRPARDWGVRFSYREPVPENHEDPDALGFTDLPRWSLLYFETLAPEWRVNQFDHGHPVEVERAWGQGSLVLAADTFLASNEAQWNNRQAPRLVRLIGPHRHLIFDESHLGTVERGSVAGLMRRYHLQGIVAVLLLLAGLFIWKSAVPFLPPVEAASASATAVRGESAATGFVRLLRRTVPRRQLLATCWQEWSRTARLLPRLRQPQIERAGQLAASSSEPLPAYLAIQRTLSERD